MDWWGSIFRGKRPNTKNYPFFNSLRFNNNHLFQKGPNTKLNRFRKIYNFVTKTFIYKCRFEIFENKEVWLCCQAFIEPHLPIHGILTARAPELILYDDSSHGSLRHRPPHPGLCADWSFNTIPLNLRQSLGLFPAQGTSESSLQRAVALLQSRKYR